MTKTDYKDQYHMNPVKHPMCIRDEHPMYIRQDEVLTNKNLIVKINKEMTEAQIASRKQERLAELQAQVKARKPVDQIKRGIGDV